MIDFKINDKTNIKKYHMISSSINALNVCEDIINNFKIENISLINVYGLLQGLFVGIDSLYTLSYAINENKYMININLNENLKKIKYIRNDCVGHPTNREYSSSLGYCYLDFDIKKESIKYRISKIKNNIEYETSYDVNLLETINAYIIERDKILRVLKKNYETKNQYKISNQILKLYKDIYLIDKIKNDYKVHVNSETIDRILWRLEIIKDLSKLNDNISKYLMNIEIYKVYKMACSIEKIRPKTMSFEMPKEIITYIKFVKENKIYFEKSNDYKNIEFSLLLDILKEVKEVQTIYNYLVKNQKNENVIYAFDKLIRCNIKKS